MKTHILVILALLPSLCYGLTEPELVAKYQAQISGYYTITAAKQKKVDLIRALLADQAGKGGDVSSYSARWEAVIAGYKKNGISAAEKEWTAIINGFLADAHSIPHDHGSGHDHEAPDCQCVQSGNWSDPKTWGGKLPEAGQDVVIPAGLMITYDADAPTQSGTGARLIRARDPAGKAARL